jgi:hypothetical protein
VGAAVAGNWRSKYSQALAGADVLIVLVTEASFASRNVLGEIGAARVLQHVRGTLLLPVLVGNIPIPEFIADIYCFRLREPFNLDSLVEGLDKAIDDNIKLIPRIFISHRHNDEPIVAALTALLEQAFYIERSDVRCTSVQPYMLTRRAHLGAVANRDCRCGVSDRGVEPGHIRVQLRIVRARSFLGEGRANVSRTGPRCDICGRAISVERTAQRLARGRRELPAACGLYCE